MNTQRLLTGIATLALGFAAAACGDAPSAPLAPSAAPSALTLPNGAALVAKTSVEGLKWKAELPANVSASQTIGVLGGQVSLPGLGVRLTVPPGAVLTSTRFTVTALAGKAVAFDFQPHGAQFLTPLMLSFDGGRASLVAPALGLTPSLGYFPTAGDLNQARGVASVTELLPNVGVSLFGTMTFPVHHFSGYIVCWGRTTRGSTTAY